MGLAQKLKPVGTAGSSLINIPFANCFFQYTFLNHSQIEKERRQEFENKDSLALFPATMSSSECSLCVAQKLTFLLFI